MWKMVWISSIGETNLAVYSAWFQACMTKSLEAVPNCSVVKVGAEGLGVMLGQVNIQLDVGEVDG